MDGKFNIEEGNFTILPNEILRYEDEDGRRLRPEVIGLYAVMISLPDDWDYTVMGLTKIVRAGKNKITGLIKELEEAGYVTRERTRNKDGTLGVMNYVVRRTKGNVPTPCFPAVDKQAVDNPAVDNDTQVSTKVVSTNVVSTKRDIVAQVITHLNKLTGKHFRHSTASTIKSISGRLNDGYVLQDFIDVIDVKFEEWNGDSKMEKYLRPNTLFTPTNFENYYNQSQDISKQIDNKLEERMLDNMKEGELF